jgi:hypothetical protein
MILPKPLCKKVFAVPTHVALSDSEHKAMVGFLRGVMWGSNYECKDWVQDVAPFLCKFRPDWARLYARHCAKALDGVDEWPVFGEAGKDDVVMFITRAKNEHGYMAETSVVEEPLECWQRSW